MIMFMPMIAYAVSVGEIMDPSSIYAVLIVMILEYVLGKTDWIEANSTVELVLNLVLKLFKKESTL